MLPKSLLIAICIFGLNAKLMAQSPSPHKNPVKAMFIQRYFHLSSAYYSLAYTFRAQWFKRYLHYASPYDKKGWELTFEDNFDSIHKNKWRLGQPWGYFHDGNLNQYHDENNLHIDRGLLYLEGKYAPKTFKHHDTDVVIPYSIGLINSDISFSQKYGYFEIRCKNPKGPATWPAFWLTGAHRWPPEIDIFEMYGKKTGQKVHRQISSIHFGISNTRSRGTLIRKFWLPRDTDSNFHVYACEWSRRKIKFYTDGVLVRTQRLNKKLQKFMDDEMVIIISNGFEAKYLKYLPSDFKGNAFVVDWVRVYKRNLK